MISKRMLLGSMVALTCVPGAKPARAALPPIPMDRHERYMRLAIEQGRKNPAYPFGAVIVRPETDEVMASGVNKTRENPTLHGEIVCMDDYIARHGNRGWDALVLYTTCEPCPMCMTAMVFAGIGGVVFGTTNTDGLRKAGMDPIAISAKDVVDAAPFYKGHLLLGGVLASETDRMFLERKR